MNTRRLALLITLTALCVGIQLTPRLPNVESTSFICFLVGFLFGSFLGASLGALTMFINGFLSPWGFAGVIMPFQMLGMALMGFMGGVYRRLLGGGGGIPKSNVLNLEVSFLAAFFTLIYDVITNVGWALPTNTPVVVALFSGALYTVIHVVSNAFLFGTAFLPLTRIVGNLAGESIWSYQKEV